MNCHTIGYATVADPETVVGSIGTCGDSILQVQGKGMVQAGVLETGDLLVMSWGVVRVVTVTPVVEE